MLFSGVLKLIVTSWSRSVFNVLAKFINDGFLVGRVIMMVFKNDVVFFRVVYFVLFELFVKGLFGCVYEIIISVFCDV